MSNLIVFKDKVELKIAIAEEEGIVDNTLQEVEGANDTFAASEDVEEIDEPLQPARVADDTLDIAVGNIRILGEDLERNECLGASKEEEENEVVEIVIWNKNENVLVTYTLPLLCHYSRS